MNFAFFDHWQLTPEIQVSIGLMILFLFAWLAGRLAKQVLVRLAHVLATRMTWKIADAIHEKKVASKLAQMAPSLMVQFGLMFIPHMPEGLGKIILNVALSTTILFLTFTVNALLDAAELYYSRSSSGQTRSIKSYVQLLKIIIYILGGIVIVSTLIDRSPLILLSGLGAMSAVLLLVFKDTLLSLVASLQLTSNDMLRVGDWIEMPQVGADGDVIEVALHTVKVQNWDKTITTIPTQRLIAESYRNWRGMKQAGGRRIKRTLRINAENVHFLTEAQIDRLMKIRILSEYLAEKNYSLKKSNQSLIDDIPANRRRLTNIGTFRAYASAYLKTHPEIHQGMTCMVRLREPLPDGIPIEVYCFTKTIVWLEYERIQGDIFDHLLAILPEFGLSLFQYPTGTDLRSMQPNTSTEPSIKTP